jgi:hypothetical protein
VLTNIDDKLMQKSTQNYSNSSELQQTVTAHTPFDRGFCFSNFLDDPDTTPNEMTLQGSIGTISGKSALQKCHEVSGERIPNSSTTEVFEIPEFLHAGNRCHANDALGDYCAKFNFMKASHAEQLGLVLNHSKPKDVAIGSGKGSERWVQSKLPTNSRRSPIDMSFYFTSSRNVFTMSFSANRF